MDAQQQPAQWLPDMVPPPQVRPLMRQDAAQLRLRQIRRQIYARAEQSQYKWVAQPVADIFPIPGRDGLPHQQTQAQPA